MFPRSSTSHDNYNTTSASTTIHINPNFKRKIGTEPPVVETPAHINPKFLIKKQHVGPCIHMNPNFLPLMQLALTTTTGTITTNTISQLPLQTSALSLSSTITTTKDETQSVQANINTTTNKYKLDKRSLQPPTANPVKIQSTDFHHMPRFKETSTTTSTTTSSSSIRNLNLVNKNKTLQTVTINGVQYNSTGRKLERKDVNKNINLPKIINNNSNQTQKYTILQRFKLQRSLKNIETSSAYRLLEVKKFKLQQQLKQRNKDYLNSVKQRSLMMLRLRLVKSNVPCAIFQRLGKCRAHEIGRCNKVHSKKHVLTCKKFLRGECHNEKCLMSHDATFAKMPVCRYFLQALCSRDNCPYLHKKLNDNATICIDFLRGFCALADKCNKRHEFLKRTTAKLTSPQTFKTCRIVDKDSEQVPKYKRANQKEIKEKIEKNSSISKTTTRDKSCEKMRYFADGEKSEIKLETFRKSTSDETVGNESEVEEINNTKQSHLQRPKLGDLPAYIPIA